MGGGLRRWVGFGFFCCVLSVVLFCPRCFCLIHGGRKKKKKKIRGGGGGGGGRVLFRFVCTCR
eukprot:COSAG06_NODE_51168_length_314_cov_0.441860_1_plen_62_part_01